MISDFELALRGLADEEKPLTDHLLAMLSAPTRTETVAFRVRWQAMSEQRRREVIQRMVKLAEESFELDYTALFRQCIHGSDPEVRRHAIDGLWEDEGADLVEPLLEMLRHDPDVLVRTAVASTLGRFVFQAECEELDERFAAKIRAALEQVIANPEEPLEVRRRAVEAIAFINDDRVRRIIDQAYAHEDDRMRESAVFAMGRSADPFWADTVLLELDASEASMRYEAVRACGEMQLRRAVLPLIKAAQDPDADVQQIAVWALGQIGGKRAKEALRILAGGDDETLSSAALDALDEIEFAVRPMDLLVHDLNEADYAQVALDTEDDEEDEEDELGEDEEWADDFMELDS